MNENGDLTMTYNFAAFQDLKVLFDMVDTLFRNSVGAGFMSSLPASVQEHLRMLEFSDKLSEINRNSSSLASFRKRFFQFFDGFVILRFLNLAHQKYYPQQNLSEAIKQLEECSFGQK
jgi:hypothetical protein